MKIELDKPTESYVTFTNRHMILDINRFLKSEAGKKSLRDAEALTQRLIADGQIEDRTKD